MNNASKFKDFIDEFFRRIESLEGETLTSGGISSSGKLSSTEDGAMLNKRIEDYMLKRTDSPIDKDVINGALLRVLEDKLK